MITAELLQNYPLDLRVVANGYEDGYDDLSSEQLTVVKIALNSGKHPWEGQHGDLDDLTGGAADCAEVEDALVLRRGSN